MQRTLTDPHIGDKVRFKPAAWEVKGVGDALNWGIKAYADGVVDYINEKHRFYRVSYEASGKQLYECFKY